MRIRNTGFLNKWPPLYCTCQVVHPIFSKLQKPELTPDIFGHAIRPMRILQEVVYTVHTVRYETMALKQLVEKIK